MTPKLSRRTLLRGLGLGAGAGLLAPLVSRLASASPSPPSRFLFIVEGNCFEPITMLADGPRASIDATLSSPLGDDRWWPRRYSHDTPIIEPTDFGSAPALGAIAADSTLAGQAAVVFGLSSRIAGGGHSSKHGALASARTVAGVPGGPTIDAHLARLDCVRGDAPYDAVRLGASPQLYEPLDFGTCAFAAGKSAPLILRPDVAFASLFGPVGSDAERAEFRKRRSLLDFASEDIRAAIGTFPGSSDERAKLETYLASVEELTQRHERILSLAPELEATAPASPTDSPLYASADPLDRLRVNLELAAASFKGALTQVAVVGSGTGGSFSFSYPTVSPDVARHDLHHGSGRNEDFRRRIHEVTRLQVEIIADVAADLAATPETTGDGSMLDHTVIVFIGDNGEQHHSSASEFPVLLLGGGALGLQTGGRTIVYPGLDADGHRQVSNLWNTLGYLAGEPLDEFGAEGPTRRAPGPLSELMG